MSARGTQWLDFINDATFWQRATFPKESVQGALAHLGREAEEIALACAAASRLDPRVLPLSPVVSADLLEEAADALLLALAVADRLTGDPHALLDAAVRKLAKNRTRKWKPADAEGVVEHVEERDDPFMADHRIQPPYTCFKCRVVMDYREGSLGVFACSTCGFTVCT